VLVISIKHKSTDKQHFFACTGAVVLLSFGVPFTLLEFGLANKANYFLKKVVKKTLRKHLKSGEIWFLLHR